jgi:hypothetical protein
MQQESRRRKEATDDRSRSPFVCVLCVNDMCSRKLQKHETQSFFGAVYSITSHSLTSHSEHNHIPVQNEKSVTSIDESIVTKGWVHAARAMRPSRIGDGKGGASLCESMQESLQKRDNRRGKPRVFVRVVEAETRLFQVEFLSCRHCLSAAAAALVLLSAKPLKPFTSTRPSSPRLCNLIHPPRANTSVWPRCSL